MPECRRGSHALLTRTQWFWNRTANDEANAWYGTSGHMGAGGRAARRPPRSSRTVRPGRIAAPMRCDATLRRAESRQRAPRAGTGPAGRPGRARARAVAGWVAWAGERKRRAAGPASTTTRGEEASVVSLGPGPGAPRGTGHDRASGICMHAWASHVRLQAPSRPFVEQVCRIGLGSYPEETL